MQDEILNDETAKEQKIVLVTGPSGAGRTTAIRVLEDLGYEVIDNLPLSLCHRVLDGPALGEPLALGVDVRNRDFSTETMLKLIDELSDDNKLDLEVLYLDCSRDVLIRRYSETRRRHPLAPAETPDLGVSREIELLQPIRSRADIIIDTSDLSPHDLKDELMQWLSQSGTENLAVSVHSFSYKRGIPRGLDMVFDVRFLQNPHWEPDLQQLNGTAPQVAQFVARDPRYDEFFDRVTELCRFLLPAFGAEGKSHLAIGFGCTGGQHRSVALVESLSKALAQQGRAVSVRHREMERKSQAALTMKQAGL